MYVLSLVHLRGESIRLTMHTARIVLMIELHVRFLISSPRRRRSRSCGYLEKEKSVTLFVSSSMDRTNGIS